MIAFHLEKKADLTVAAIRMEQTIITESSV